VAFESTPPTRLVP